MLRPPKRKEINEWEKQEIIQVWTDDYGYSDAKVEWRNGKKSFGLDGGYRLILDGECVGDFLFCDGCGEIFEWIAGNVYDNMDRCPECGLAWDKKARGIQ